MATKYVALKNNNQSKLRENGRFEVSIPLTLIKKLDRYCAKSNMKRSEAVEIIIELYLKRRH